MVVLDEGGGGEERTSGRQMRRSLLGVRVKLLSGRCYVRTYVRRLLSILVWSRRHRLCPIEIFKVFTRAYCRARLRMPTPDCISRIRLCISRITGWSPFNVVVTSPPRITLLGLRTDQATRQGRKSVLGVGIGLYSSIQIPTPEDL